MRFALDTANTHNVNAMRLCGVSNDVTTTPAALGLCGALLLLPPLLRDQYSACLLSVLNTILPSSAFSGVLASFVDGRVNIISDALWRCNKLKRTTRK